MPFIKFGVPLRNINFGLTYNEHVGEKVTMIEMQSILNLTFDLDVLNMKFFTGAIKRKVELSHGTDDEVYLELVDRWDSCISLIRCRYIFH